VAMQRSGARKRSSIPVWLLGLCVLSWGLSSFFAWNYSSLSERSMFQLGAHDGCVRLDEWRYCADPEDNPQLWKGVRFIHAMSRMSLKEPRIRFQDWPNELGRFGFRALYFKWRQGKRYPGQTPEVPFVTSEIILPLWLPTAVCLLASIPWFRQRLRRRGPYECDDCRYSLVGNTTGICPECGTAIPDAMRAALQRIEFKPPAQ